MEPTLWQVVDTDVWIAERGHLDGLPNVLAVVNKKAIHGGGIMSPAQSRHLRMIGRGEARRFEINIEHCGHKQIRPGRLPKHLGAEFHPGGNSLCYAVQLAHLMGAERIVAVGFTLQTGSRYQHQGGNPATRRETAKYGDIARPLAWLRWYSETFPGMLWLDATFGGPIYELPEEAVPRFKGEHRAEGEDPAVGQQEG
jgi:hypothetical protein